MYKAECVFECVVVFVFFALIFMYPILFGFQQLLVLLIPVLSLSIKEREGLYDVYSNCE